MKKLALVIGLLIIVGLCIPGALAAKPTEKTWQVSGPHYNLNIIGMAKDTKLVGDSDGHTMFVKLDGRTKIMMTQNAGGEFYVTDRNGLDGTAAFNIAPGYYNVYARGLGKPSEDTWVDINAYGNFTDPSDATGSSIEWLGYVNIARTSAKPQVVNINNLFYVDVVVCTAGTVGDCTEETVYTDTWVFDIPELLDYYWDYDNNNLKLLQVRFYQCTLDADGLNLPADYCRWGDGNPIISTKTTRAA